MTVSNAQGTRSLIAVLAVLSLVACTDSPSATSDAGREDGAYLVDGSTPHDSAVDAGVDATLGDAMLEGDSGADAGFEYDAGPLGCLEPTSTRGAPIDRLEDAIGTATVVIEDPEACQRRYELSSTAVRRTGELANPRIILEREGAPSVRTGNHLFDALHALAIEEAHENSVGAVRDYAFAEGNPLPCGGDHGCFETGRLWNYVWTRDIAYSVDLGLAALDPLRSMGSLDFKTSERRGGGGLEIVQDTGTGGSWPVSTDRVAWALGAAELLPWLSEPHRSAFQTRAWLAIHGTIERDRRTIFDPRDGLYRGEQSFLDWREQTYPSWVSGDLAHIAMSKTLSTNLLHLRAIELASELADRRGDSANASRYREWAERLRSAIHAHFWLEEEGLFSTYVTTALDPAPVRRFDLLGESLAILMNVASEAEAIRILSTYPHLGPGAAPVIHPQQQHVRIYHNRAEWPFVTAYLLRAARHVGHDAAGDRAVHSLMRGAALNLSNMENFEAASGRPWLDDGDASGPVVNSERQLWSVAGYLAMVHHVIFGIEAQRDELSIRPWITAKTRHEIFANTDEIVLRNFEWRGHSFDVVVHFPEGDGAGGFQVVDIEIDGQTIGVRAITSVDLRAHSRVDVRLGPSDAGETTIKVNDASDWRAVFGPRTPAIRAIAVETSRVRLSLEHPEAPDDVVLSVYRDGVRVASDLPGATTTYLDEATDADAISHCWAIESCFVSTRTCSQHSAPICHWGPNTERVHVFDATTFAATGGAAVTEYGRFHYQAWGDPGDRLETPSFTAPTSGEYLLQVQYGNGGPTDTGITAAIKRVLVEDAATHEITSEGVLVMPHMGAWENWGESSLARVHLERGRSYRFIIQGDDDTVNMSAFQHFADYTAGLGGRDGAFQRVNIAELRILNLARE
jgi:hypothetical protein